jgi:hypothetical protein
MVDTDSYVTLHTQANMDLTAPIFTKQKLTENVCGHLVQRTLSKSEQTCRQQEQN